MTYVLQHSHIQQEWQMTLVEEIINCQNFFVVMILRMQHAVAYGHLSRGGGGSYSTISNSIVDVSY